jgi:hypothetical protein
MVSCQKCGNELSTEGARFCDICGEPLSNSPQLNLNGQNDPTRNHSNYPTKSRKRIISVPVILGIVLVLFIAWLSMPNSYDGEQSSNLVETAENAPIIDTTYSDQGEIIAGEVFYYTVTVPSDAVKARLTGTYQVMGGEEIQVDVLEADGCSSPLNAFECVSIYSISRNNGNVDLNLEPGKMYYLEFTNKAFLFPAKTVNIDFQLEVTY